MTFAEEAMTVDWKLATVMIGLTVLLVILNGFFVAAEFALVKVRPSRLSRLVHERRTFARTGQWLHARMDRALSACQLGITMASLGLGWIGEPAIARLLEPVLHAAGVTSEVALHTVAFIVAFTIITAAHLVLGEQAPKIYAIRRPEPMTLWCALPLRWFYVASYPFITALNGATAFLLRLIGLEGAGDHDMPHSEEELRALLSQAHAKGELTRSEHRLLDAVFEFDDTLCRQIMVPRVEVQIIDVAEPVGEILRRMRSARHTRYPICEGSLDHVLGVIHLKDLVGLRLDEDVEMTKLMRAPKYVPETVPISKLLAHFRASRQHLAFVVDEYGSVVGIVTMEDVLERIVGSVQDEFDMEDPHIVPDGSGRFIVDGSTPIPDVNRALRLSLEGRGVDTIGGLVMEQLDRVAAAGDRVPLEGARAEVLAVTNARATRIRIVLDPAAGDDENGQSQSSP